MIGGLNKIPNGRGMTMVGCGMKKYFSNLDPKFWVEKIKNYIRCE